MTEMGLACGAGFVEVCESFTLETSEGVLNEVDVYEVIVEAVVERPGAVDDDEMLATAVTAKAEVVATDFDNAEVVKGLDTAMVVIAELTADCLDGESSVSLAPDCTAIV